MLRYTHYVAVAATAAGIAGIVASAAVSDEGGTPDPRPAHAASISLAVDSALVDSFSIFRAPATTGDSMPSEVVASAASPERYGRNARLAKGVETVNGPGWVVPGNDAICLVVPDPVDGYGSSCVSAAYGTKFGVIVGMIAPREPKVVRISMLLPDGANAEVHSDGHAGNALPRDGEGTIAAMVSAGSAIQITSADGATIRLELPTSAPMNAHPQAR